MCATVGDEYIKNIQTHVKHIYELFCSIGMLADSSQNRVPHMFAIYLLIPVKRLILAIQGAWDNIGT